MTQVASVDPENQVLFHVAFRPPLDWASMLNFLSARATPGVECVRADTYQRSISINGHHGYFEVSLDERNSSLIVRINLDDPGSLFFVVERIRLMFDLNADWTTIAQTLRNDPALVPHLEAHRGLRVPGCWNGFELAVRAVLGQQVSVKAATTFAGRLANAFGEPFVGGKNLSHRFPTPECLAEAKLGVIGITGARAETLRLLARATCDRRINFERVADNEQFLNCLRAVPGIGEWTVQYIAMRALAEPDALPLNDRALQRALNIETARELELRAELWRPWRAYAAMYFWRSQSAA
jgi:AraC family transcriptional regulator of adaptative response / DNA-3-methyladenine glycosylase II